VVKKAGDFDEISLRGVIVKSKSGGIMRTGTRQLLLYAVLICAVLILTGAVRSHCQMPCGIYDDHTRIEMIAENITTIEMCINRITTLSEQKPLNTNQVVRWIDTKEAHADDTAHIITHYFMAQRLKPVDASDKNGHDKYIAQLSCLHEMLYYSMKAKQSTDTGNTVKLKALLDRFEKMYFKVAAGG
jgi:nickel superoxide dismutase